MEKDYLTGKGIKFEDIVVDQRPGEMPKMIDTCGAMGVPCTHILKDDGTEERILGFDRSRIDAALKLV